MKNGSLHEKRRPVGETVRSEHHRENYRDANGIFASLRRYSITEILSGARC